MNAVPQPEYGHTVGRAVLALDKVIVCVRQMVAMKLISADETDGQISVKLIDFAHCCDYNTANLHAVLFSRRFNSARQSLFQKARITTVDGKGHGYPGKRLVVCTRDGEHGGPSAISPDDLHAAMRALQRAHCVCYTNGRRDMHQRRCPISNIYLLKVGILLYICEEEIKCLYMNMCSPVETKRRAYKHLLLFHN
jgi:hypothetical protein